MAAKYRIVSRAFDYSPEQYYFWVERREGGFAWLFGWIKVFHVDSTNIRGVNGCLKDCRAWIAKDKNKPKNPYKIWEEC